MKIGSIKITKGNFWYKGLEGTEFPILQEYPMGYIVEIIDDVIYYVNKEDCVVVSSTVESKSIKLKLFPNSKGVTIDPPEVFPNGNWIDLRACLDFTDIRYLRGDILTINLGIGMILPEEYEAIIAPRSSLFNRYGLILTNSIGIIDTSYNGNEDQWKAVLYALKDGILPFNERILQFRIVKKQPSLSFTIVDELNPISRGGYGEGTKNVK